MYKVFTALLSKTTSPSKELLKTNVEHKEDDDWVLVSDAVMITPTMKGNTIMTNSWIATPPLIKNDASTMNVHHFNPIENLLIEHASMSVYEQIASKAANKRQKSTVHKMDEEIDNDEDEDEDERTFIEYQNSNLTSFLNQNSSVTNLDSSLIGHQRYLNRLHQRRKRSTKPSSSTSNDDSKQLINKAIERQRLNHARSPKILFQQSSRLIH
ncbi:unnamed protein product [Adineta ricciae]|uniref:Uncharacterized protein n=2 Tax=Adineta ricciae TaxID=249248 RepID=A0A814SRU5_ADIRI|nr:unnamed protein product [Adineta ricciae]